MSVRHLHPFGASRNDSSSDTFFHREPNDPSDVTEIIGSGKVDMGAKAMVSWGIGAIGAIWQWSGIAHHLD